MSSSIKISHLNPVRFYLFGTGDTWSNLLPYFEHHTNYFCKYRAGDQFRMQILCDEELDPGISIDVVSLETGEIVNSSLMSNTYPTIPETIRQYGDYYVYNWVGQIADDYSPVTRELIQIVLTVPHTTGDIVLKSEPIMLFNDTHSDKVIDNTMVILYTHGENDYDTYFVDAEGENDQVTFLMRVEGGFKSDGQTPGGKFTMFQDMQQRPVMLSAVPILTERVTFGSGYGIPNWLADKINRIFALDTVTIDGTQYSRAEGAKMERLTSDLIYPASAWHMDLVKTDNPYSDSADVVG